MAKIKVIDYPLNNGQSFLNQDIKEAIKADLIAKNSDKKQFVARVISKSDNGVLFINGDSEILLETDKTFSYFDALILGCFDANVEGA